LLDLFVITSDTSHSYIDCSVAQDANSRQSYLLALTKNVIFSLLFYPASDIYEWFIPGKVSFVISVEGLITHAKRINAGVCAGDM